jgi:hypothetical protein
MDVKALFSKGLNMDAHEIMTSAVASGGLTVGGGALVAWFVRYQVKRILTAIEQIPKDLTGLSIKIDKVENQIEEKIHQEVSLVKDKVNDLKTELKIESARMDERIKFLENKK